VEFRILGPLEVVEQGRPLALGGPRQRALLALLLTRANEVVSADRLVEELWPAGPPATAGNALQYHVSQLRKVLAPAEVVLTQEPGYFIRVGPDELDLSRFERLVEESQSASPQLAASLLREALALWRGAALADLADEAFAGPEIQRLEELRLGALERRIEADLSLGRHGDVVAELEGLTRRHPLRERLRAQLMRALYGSGRQADALEVYRRTRTLLVDELGIEPSPALQQLEQAVLRHDPSLAPREAVTSVPASPRGRAIVVLSINEERLDELVTIAEALARRADRELILTCLLREGEDVGAATAALAERRSRLADRGVASRVAVYTAAEPGSEAAALAAEHDVDLVLADNSSQLLDSGRFDPELAVVLSQAPCDVAVLTGGRDPGSGAVVTPFGGVEHDWSAIELAAWLAGSFETTLRLVGTEADASRGRRDASRLLARASLLVQQVIGIVAEPILVPAGEKGVLAAARGARVLVLGLSERWTSEGIGPARLAVAAGAGVPTLFVRRGLRPSGVAPPATLTRFTWTLAAEPPGR
jgi:DNA-binding SARP family transcriptional activator